ncbi:MAG: DUF302 domain-containing protein [Thermoflavifilum sp.]|nr:DUF302 domain-containing protein [Thermoflavifilum sp.]
MSYYFNTRLENVTFEEAIQRVTDALQAEGFGVLTEIDVQATLKKKLNVDFRKYRILGACNPPFAYQALQAEDKIGTMLPCNVVVEENTAGEIEVTAVDPVASMAAVHNDQLKNIAEEVRKKLQQVLHRLAPNH